MKITVFAKFILLFYFICYILKVTYYYTKEDFANGEVITFFPVKCKSKEK